MPQYFVHNGDGGLEFYDDRVEAKSAAMAWIDEYRTLPEWDEAVDHVCWGLVMQHTIEVDHQGEFGREYVDYVLKDVP